MTYQKQLKVEPLHNHIPIFVYGTLMEGCRNYRRALFRYSKKMEIAKTRGTLYHLKDKGYPALIIKGDPFVMGEVHWIEQELFEQAIDEFDAIENFEMGRERINEYNREFIEVLLADGTTKQMQCYIYNECSNYNQKDKRILVESGDWKEYLAKHHLGC